MRGELPSASLLPKDPSSMSSTLLNCPPMVQGSPILKLRLPTSLDSLKPTIFHTAWIRGLSLRGQEGQERRRSASQEGQGLVQRRGGRPRRLGCLQGREKERGRRGSGGGWKQAPPLHVTLPPHQSLDTECDFFYLLDILLYNYPYPSQIGGTKLIIFYSNYPSNY